jgi:hypothetical protein
MTARSASAASGTTSGTPAGRQASRTAVLASVTITPGPTSQMKRRLWACSYLGASRGSTRASSG